MSANSITETTLRRILQKKGFSLSAELKNGQTGVDILATRDGEEPIYIEVIGYKSKGPARTKDFCEGFFRSVSRLSIGASRCILAMPVEFLRGMPQRALIYQVAWNRTHSAFPEFRFWFVDVQNSTYEERVLTSWSTQAEQGGGANPAKPGGSP